MSEQISQCEQCQQHYHLFRRKKQCHLCGQIFCSKCVPRSTLISLHHSRTCAICLLIINERTTRDQLAAIRVKHLRAYLIHSKIISRNRLETCLEKQDLIHLIESKKRQTIDETYVFVERSETNIDIETRTINNQPDVQEPITNGNEQASSTSNVSSTSSSEPTPEVLVDPPVVPNHSDRITLDHLSSFESIHDLTIRQLKDILTQNFVSIKECVEKNELITKLQLLYRDHHQQKESTITISTKQSDENLCKVCMDGNIDCVFLDCGHLCTCIQCGKKLSECPLCRSYIIRVVRVFKS